MVRALVFDFDGLILDTEVPEFRAWCEIFEGHGCELPRSEWTACIGLAGADVTFDPHACLEGLLGRPLDRAEVRARHRLRFAELVAAESALPGVTEYLMEARRLGLKVAVASSSHRAWITAHLGRLGLLEAFDCFRCADDVARTKPDPELYRAALAALAVAPEEAIAFEDSANGVRAAKAAGLYCVAVPNGLTCALPLEEADLRLNSLAEMPLETLLRLRHGVR